ncbi:unnamed protein product [Choristocarpus tenellus]
MSAPAKAKSVRPPEKGAFPLDHDGECKPQMKSFLQCLRQSEGDHLPCKSLSKVYLACRMERNLMAQEDLDKLGFSSEGQYERIRQGITVEEGKKEGSGFIGGTHIKQRGGGWLSSK